ncbi:NACHT domain-containing protein [Streptomyces griseosporeus]|uniref:NACHT domain-containing protein n=1 Tax=Streptomyces griseosporeus TaxID=1910 RepID=UPI0036FA5202
MLVQDVDGHAATGRRGVRRRWRRGRYSTQPLAEALARPDADLVLLQGVAGSGKSVALRRHALSLLEEIESGRAPADTPLPVYVNLRELGASPDDINTELLRRYIVEQTGPRGSTDVAAYFAHCFADDLRHRRVVLLLDSFDEIPAVLGSATVDAVVSPYVQTIIELVGGGGRCVVACREYKGLRSTGWTQLHILGLSLTQQEEFLRAARLDDEGVERVRELLTDPRRGFTTELRNPLSLKLLAAYVRSRQSAPDRPSALFAEFASLRVRAGLAHAGLDPDSRRAAEIQRRLDRFLDRFAFRLTASGGGLSVSEASLRTALREETEDVPVLRALIDRALTGSRIIGFSSATADEDGGDSEAADPGGRRVFFGHRRVQQYFASRYVAAHPDAVARDELATNGRWRETVVTVLQDGPPEVTGPLLDALTLVLRGELDRARHADAGEFAWSPAAVHVLELLTAAYQGRADWPYETARPLIEELVDEAWRGGSVSDRKFALDCLPLLSEEARAQYIDRAFAGDSNWIRVTALRDCATLPSLTPAIRASIRRLLITRPARRTSAAETQALDVDLERLRGTDDFVGIRKIVDRTPLWVAALAVPIALTMATDHGTGDETLDLWQRPSMALLTVVSPIVLFWVFQSTDPLSYPSGRRAAFLDGLVRSWRSALTTRTEKAFEFLGVMAILFLALFVIPAARLAGGHLTLTGFAIVLGKATELFWPMFWGQSVLYAVHKGWTTRQLRPARRVLVFILLIERGWAALRGGIRALPRTFVPAALAVVGLGGFYWFLSTHVADVIGAVLFTLMALLALANVIRTALHDLRSRHRVDQALRVYGGDPPLLFTALFTLRDATEAAEYVRRVRDVPRAGPLDVDRATLRWCIAALQDRSPQATGVSPEGLRRLERWKGDAELLDELGRLDEQLRAR